MLRSTLVTMFSALAAFAQAPERSVSIPELMRSNPGVALRALAAEPQRSFHGTLSALVFDDPATGQTQTSTTLQIGDETYPVYSAAPAASGCLGLVDVRGYMVGSQILASAISGVGPRNASCSTLGDQKTLVLLASTPTHPTPSLLTLSFVQNFMSVGPGTTVDGYFREVSKSQVTVTSTVLTPIHLPKDYPCILDQTTLVADALGMVDSTIDLKQFTRIIVIAPRASASCPSRLSSVSCQNLTTPIAGTFTASWAYIADDILTARDAGVSAASKAIGYGLGLRGAYTRDFGAVPIGPFGVAGTDTLTNTVGDDHSIMGGFQPYGPAPGVFPLGHISALQKAFLGWYKNSPTPSPDFLTTETNSTNTIEAASSPSAGLKALRVRRGTGFNEWLWVEFRQFLGYDATLLNYAPALDTGVLIYDERVPPDSLGPSYLLDFNPVPAANDFRAPMLPAGSTWTDPYSNLQLQVQSAAAGTAMQVTATYLPTGGCGYVLSPPVANVNKNAGVVSFTVTTGPFCEWLAALTPNPGFATFGSIPSGLGTGSVNVNYAANAIGASRSATFSVAGQTATLNQSNTAPSAQLSLDRTRLNYAGTNSSLLTPSQKVVVSFGGGSAAWTASSDQSWFQVTPTSGTGPTRLTVSINSALLPPSGTATGTLTVTAPTATPTSKTVSVNLTRLATSVAPFGSFDTPLNNATGIAGSIAVTGWAMDDIYVSSVKVYRDKIGNEGVQPNGLIYIGDAVFINNARSDIEGLNPTLPFNYRGGWGYLMLTNAIPGGSLPLGNGTIKLWAIATDIEGNTTNLGSKVITLTNATSKLPFGAIDNPGQGGSAIGTIANSGWIMTPQPNIMLASPVNIGVYVDGAPVGKVTFGQARPDVFGLFPNNRNSSGPGATFSLDTSLFSNAMHSIYWIAYDDAGNGDGIGSRFFFIENGLAAGIASPVLPVISSQLEPAAVRSARPRPQRAAVPQVRTAQELDRLVIDLPEGQWTGAHVINGDMQPLPAGSTLDNANGVFYWHLGPGFLGAHELLFTSTDGAVLGLTVNIEPKSFAERQ